LTNAVKLGGGFFHTLALTAESLVVTWGTSMADGATNMPPGLSNVVDVAGGVYHSLVLKSDGTVSSWGSYVGTNVPSGLSNVVLIAAGAYQGLAIKSDGTLAEWGQVSPNAPAAIAGVRSVACGGAHSLALRSDGTVVVWGDNYFGQTNMPPGLTNVTVIACGGNHSVVLKADGQVVAWGNNSRGQISVPPGLSEVVELAAGNEFSVALKADGTVVAWGDYVGTNLPPGLTNLESIVAGGYYTAALTGIGPPRIIQQPLDAVAVAGDTPIFRCVVSGSPRAPVQWQHNGLGIPGETNQTLALAGVVPDQAGAYSLSASNGSVNLHSASANLTVIPLVVTSQPTNVAAYGGDAVIFRVQARNLGPFWYQWRHDGVELPDKTDSTILLSNTSTNDVGNYSVVVSNQYGFALSSDASLNVTPIVLTAQPTNRTIFSGESTTFGVAAWKNGPFAYQWAFNDMDLPGQTNAALLLTNATTNQSGSYTVRVANPYGSLVSSNAILTVVESSPLITGQPAGQFVWYLGSATLQVSANGSKPLRYHWRLNGNDIPVATNSSLSVTGLVANSSNAYSVLVSNPVGTTLSSNALMTVVPLSYWGSIQTSIRKAPALTNPVAIASAEIHALGLRSDGTVLAWGPAECLPALLPGLSNIIGLAVGPVHNLALRSNGTVAAWGCNSYGQTSVPLGLSNALAVAAGADHSLALKSDGTVSGWGGTGAIPPAGLRSVVALSAGDSFSLALKADGTVITWGLNSYGQTNLPAGLSNVVAIASGAYHSLALKADGSVASWGATLGGVNYGQTNVPAGLSNVAAIGAGSYHSLAVKSDGTVVAWGRNNSGQTNTPAGLSNVVAVAGGSDHSLAQVDTRGIALCRQPLSATVVQGKPVLFSAAATSSQPVSYQWRHNGADLPGATDPWLRLAATQPADEGGYSVFVSNTFGVLTSRIATLVLTDRPPVVVTPPASVASLNTTPITLSVVAAGSPTLRYQWRKDGLPIAAATTTSFALSNGRRTNGGYYSVRITNAFGSVTSADARVRVVVPLELGSPETAADGTLRVDAADPDHAPLATNDIPFCSVWASTNLADWTLLPASLSASNGLLWLRDPAIHSYPRRFYRFSEKVVWRVPVPQTLDSPNREADGAISVRFHESNGERLTPSDLPKFHVWASEDLRSWQQLTNEPVLTNGAVVLRDPAASGLPQRFYRVVELP
jgi:alpha-tubulin suppressor-like RCC1 family protein